MHIPCITLQVVMPKIGPNQPNTRTHPYRILNQCSGHQDRCSLSWDNPESWILKLNMNNLVVLASIINNWINVIWCRRGFPLFMMHYPRIISSIMLTPTFETIASGSLSNPSFEVVTSILISRIVSGILSQWFMPFMFWVYWCPLFSSLSSWNFLL